MEISILIQLSILELPVEPGDKRSERADTREFSSMFVTFPCVVVPTKKIDILVFVFGELMRSVTERLILGQAALAEIFFFAANDKLIRLNVSAFYQTCHHDLLGLISHCVACDDMPCPPAPCA